MSKLNHTLFFVEGNPALEDSNASVLGVAFDEGSCYGKGADKGPAAIIAASHQIETEQPLTGETVQAAIHNFGIIKPRTSKEMVSETEKIAKEAIDAETFFILLGGDHSVLNGALNALPMDTFFLNLDAHLDLREQWQGKRLSHAAISHRILDKGFEQLWVGARDSVGEEEIEFVSKQGLAEKIFYCPTMPGAFYAKRAFPAWMRKQNMLFNGKISAAQLQTILAAIGNKKVWLNIDFDCLDLRQGIETGTPMPHGLSLESMDELLFAICEKKNVIGFSLTEVIPSKNNSSQTIAAMLCLKIVSWRFNYPCKSNSVVTYVKSYDGEKINPVVQRKA